MIGLLGREQLETFAIETDLIQIREIGVALFAARPEEPDDALFFIHLHDLPHQPVARRDLTFDLARSPVTQIEVAEAAALGIP